MQYSRCILIGFTAPNIHLVWDLLFFYNEGFEGSFDCSVLEQFILLEGFQ